MDTPSRWVLRMQHRWSVSARPSMDYVPTEEQRSDTLARRSTQTGSRLIVARKHLREAAETVVSQVPVLPSLPILIWRSPPTT
jgi:hypothetical protein